MNSILPFNSQDAITIAIQMREVVMAVSSAVLRDGVDYGIIPGTGKPGEEKRVLMKPGAERLCSAFKLYPVFSVVSQLEDWDKGIFFYRYECALMHRETGECYGRGIGSCNSQENKYGWRWMSAPPPHLDPASLMTRSGSIQELKFAIDAAKTEGEYSKPQEYWDTWKAAIDNGTAHRVPDNKARKSKAGKVMETWEMGGIEYRVPNPDIFDIVNTIDKMGQKRALIAATLIAVNASEFYTQDVDDFDPSVFGIKAPSVTVSSDTDKGNVLTGRPAPMIKAPAPLEPAKPEAPAWWPILKEVKPKLSAGDFEAVVSDLKRGLNEGRISMSMSDSDVRAMLFEEFAIDIRTRDDLKKADDRIARGAYPGNELEVGEGHR